MGVSVFEVAAWHQLGRALTQLGDHACACAALRHALVLDGGHAPTLRALGNLMFDYGCLELALEYFDRFSRKAEA